MRTILYILFGFLLGTFAVAQVLPLHAYAQTSDCSFQDWNGWKPGMPMPTGCTPDKLEQAAGGDAGSYKPEGLQTRVNDYLNILFPLIGLFAVYFIVMNGFNMVTHANNETKAKEAQKGLTWAILGLLATILAYAIIVAVINFVFKTTAVAT